MNAKSLFIILGLLWVFVAPAQVDSLLVVDSAAVGRDSARVVADSAQWQVSADSLDKPVEYEARDSMIYDVANERVHLFGAASVSYGTVSLQADYILFDWANNTVVAEVRNDSVKGKSRAGLPQFKDGDQEFKARRMRYNFITQKGVVYEATSQEGDMFVHGQTAKFIREMGDSAKVNDVVYSRNALFTVCDLDEPHFGIRSQRQKVIPNKLVVIGPSNLEISGVPTPLWLPFGFFPVKTGQRAGLIVPKDYEYSPKWGFGLRNVGYYFPIGPSWDMQITADAYLRGTWGLHTLARYNKRYKYSGNLNLDFSDRREEQPNSIERKGTQSYSLRWSHSQDGKAHPTQRFSGNMHIQTNSYQQLNDNSAQAVFNNRLTSNVSYTKSFPGRPFTLAASLGHSQNTNTGSMDISFPVLDVRMNRIFPFKRKKRIGDERWYEQVSLRYSGNAQNKFTTSDSTLFTQQTLADARFGIKHEANSDVNFRVLKYFNLSPNVQYKEVWYFDRLQRSFDDSLSITTDTLWNADSSDYVLASDTLGFGEVNEERLRGFEPWRQLNTGVSLNTVIYGTMLFKKGFLRGLRHVVKPSVSFNYSPDYTTESLMYFDTVRIRQSTDTYLDQGYSVYEGGIYGTPSSSGRQMAINYSIINNFEAKYFSRRDSAEQKMKLFNSIYVNGNYNFARDTLRWSQVSLRGNTPLFRNISILSLSATFDPYAVNDEGQRINVFQWTQKKQLLRFVTAQLSLNTNLTARKIKSLFDDSGSQGGSRDNQSEESDTEASLFSLFEGFSVNHNFVLTRSIVNGVDTIQVTTNSLNARGAVQLTENWRVNVGNIGYDFKAKRITYPDIGLYRDLHCWEMGFNWQPQRGTYSFFIRVKPSSLGFLEFPYQKNNVDGFGGF